MGDPQKRRKTLRFLAITATIGIGIALTNVYVIQKVVKEGDPLYQCINGLDVTYQISVNMEIYVDGVKQHIPANIGMEPNCQRTMYTLSDDGVVHVAWTKPYAFTVGHFLWISGFDYRDTDDKASTVYVNGVESPDFINTVLQDGATYKADFATKNSQGAPTFTPPNQNNQ